MSQYLDGFLLTIKRSHLPAYRKLATKAGKIWCEHGAVAYRECILDDPAAPEMIPFPKLAKAKEDEVVVFSYAVFKSRKQRDTANRNIMADPRIAAMCEAMKGIVDCKRMAYGGFTSLVSL